jgi:hypothetical protein
MTEITEHELAQLQQHPGIERMRKHAEILKNGMLKAAELDGQAGRSVLY